MADPKQPGLNQQDLNILGHYADQGNRLLYWNYLAQHQGNDHYGLLALGVVRNDNMPGAVSNTYAQMQVSGTNNRTLSERQWEAFGQDLVKRDFAFRKEHMDKGETGLALNLPVKDVQKAHDAAFHQANITPDAWTPRHLLEAARAHDHGQEKEAEAIWRTMLDSSYLGTERLGKAIYKVTANDYNHPVDGAKYIAKLTAAEAVASHTLPADNPNRIGSVDISYDYSPKDKSWTQINLAPAAMGGMPDIRTVTAPHLLQELNDARAVRMERLDKAKQFHPDDANKDRPIAKSPITVAESDHHQTRTPRTQLAEQTSPAKGHAPGSIDDLFERMTHAAMQGDSKSMYAAGNEYLQSPTGQQLLQAGRDTSQIERESQATRQAQPQQVAAQETPVQRQQGPVMRM